MKITLLGNCQTKALTWYIQQLNEKFDVKWVQTKFARGSNWAKPGSFRGKPVPTVVEKENGIERVMDSSFLIYQHLSSEASDAFNSEKIKLYNPACNFISISSFYFDPDIPRENGLSGMICRAKRLNIDVPAHKIIEKHGSKITVNKKNHPHVFYFLELVREICAKTGWHYYSDEQYNQYLKEGYPFG
jgi:hypothetical protein